MTNPILIKKNAIYAYATEIKEKGLALVVLDINKDDISGIRLLLSGNENFIMKESILLNEIDAQNLLYMETLPKFVIKELKQTYKKNLNL
jgi:hypothetical protein